MAHQHGPAGSSQSPRPGWRFRTAALGFIAIAGALLLFEHRAHAFGALPWLFLLACPLLHFFMHGHGSHGDAKDNSDRRSQQ